MSIYPNLRWSMKDVGLWLNVIVSQKAPVSKQLPSNRSITKKVFAMHLTRISASGICRTNIDTSVLLFRFPSSFEMFLKARINRTTALTSAKLVNMLPWLERYPNQEITQFLTYVFFYGFSLSTFSGMGCNVISYLISAVDNPEIIREKVAKDISEGSIAGPFFPSFHKFLNLPVRSSS